MHPDPSLSNFCGVYVRASVLTFSPFAPLPYYSLLLLLLLQPVQVSINLQPGWMATGRLAGVTFGARSN